MKLKKVSKEEVKAWIKDHKDLLLWEGGILFGCIGMTVGKTLLDKAIYGKNLRKGNIHIGNTDREPGEYYIAFVPVNRFGKEMWDQRDRYKFKAENYKNVINSIEMHAKAALGESNFEE